MEGMRKTLYGPDGKSGVTGCMQRKVSWKHLGAIASFVIMIVVGATYRSMDAAENCLRERADNKQQIEVIHKDLEHIKTTNQELKNGQQKIKQEVQDLKQGQMTPEMFRQIIKDEIKKDGP
jgi:cell division protein FtsB